MAPHIEGAGVVTLSVRVLVDGEGGYVARCDQHKAWVFRTQRLTPEQILKAEKSLKAHVTRNQAIGWSYVGCVPEAY